MVSTPTYLGNVEKKKKVFGFKASRFNVRTEDKHGNLLLYNHYSNRFIRVADDNKETVIGILRNPNDAIFDSTLFQYLLVRGFLVNSAADEFRKAEMRHHQTISSDGKLSLTLMPNEDCNFRCTYCYESFAKNFMKESVQNGVIEYVRKNIKRFNEVHIDWFGGEPLTAVPIIEHISREVIKICAANRVPFSAGMTTNGYNLSLDVFKKMQACRVRSYQITLDGLEELHNKSRIRADGASTFQQIVDNLKNIRDEIKSRTFTMAIRTNVTKDVFDNISEYYDFFNKEFGKDNRFYSHLHQTGDWGGEAVKSMQGNFCTSKDIVSALKIGIDKGVSVSQLYDDQLADSVCYASKLNNYVIGSDGIIYKCTVAFDDEYNHVGFLDENGIMHLDEDKLSLWVSGHESIDNGCQKCFFRPSCQGASCPLVRIHTDQSSCPTVKTHIKEYLRIVASQSKRVEHLQEVMI